MASTQHISIIARRLSGLLGDRLREFPLAVRLDERGLFVVLAGAAGSVTALRGLREKLQPAMKQLLREHKLAPRFGTVETTEEGIGEALALRIDLP